jgi:branched-chain amino acid transport system permease protein
MAVTASRTQEPPAVQAEFRASPSGLVARAVVATLLVAIVFTIPLITDTVWDDRVSLAAIFVIIGLSINVLTGYAGQISLGHQAFVGIGAFMSAYMVGTDGPGASFFVALPVAGLTGAALALCLGLVALRIRGLYLALITLAFGLVAQETIFNIRSFTGGGAGAEAPRPTGFVSNQAYAYLCLLFVGLFLLIDWRLAKSKAGRAIVAVRNNERVAATLGINVMAYKLFAFALSGFFAGVAGSLFAHQTKFVQAQNFDFTTTLLWVLMTVVGGLGSRAGVVVGSAFFALFQYLGDLLVKIFTFGQVHIDKITIAEYAPLVGAVLLLLTVTRYPGGIGQQLLPIRRWLSGGPFVDPKHRRKKRGAGAAGAAIAQEAPLEPVGEREAEPTEVLERVGASSEEPAAAVDAANDGQADTAVDAANDGQAETAVTTQMPAVTVAAEEKTVRRGLRAFRRKG